MIFNLGSFTAECLPTNQLKVDRHVDSCVCLGLVIVSHCFEVLHDCLEEKPLLSSLAPVLLLSLTREPSVLITPGTSFSSGVPSN